MDFTGGNVFSFREVRNPNDYLRSAPSLWLGRACFIDNLSIRCQRRGRQAKEA